LSGLIPALEGIGHGLQRRVFQRGAPGRQGRGKKQKQS
jgi:hypothetical protein